MTEHEMIKSLAVIASMYRAQFTSEQYEIWYQLVGDLPQALLDEGIRRYLLNTERCHFLPQPGNILAELVHSDAKIKSMAAQDFDENPAIDGTDSFTIQHESHFDRQQRKRQYVNGDLQDWKGWPITQQLVFCKILSRDQANAIENHNRGINHAN